MRLSETWLREWVNPSIDTTQLAEQLTLCGLEVDSICPVSDSFEKVIVGEVLATEKHSQADRLSVCQVKVGEAESLEIVCGAPNVRAGLKVPVVLVGGRIGSLKIKKTKLRGVISNGMICSERELGLSDESNGIMELPKDAPVGQDIHNYLQLNDYLLDINLTPNRGDCASVMGIAREIAAINRISLNPLKLEIVEANINDIFPVEVMAEDACPRYVGRVIRDIDNTVSTPIWMRERLRRSGVRSINPVVDIVNYVMLEIGQPMHTFDLDKLSGGIQVRFAQSDERINLITNNNAEVTLDDQTLVIADQKGVQAIAGVSGGMHSAVSENTNHIFLESAYFLPENIALTARRYNLHTDSAYRFERGVDFKLQNKAIERATRLLLDIVGGKAGPIVEKQIEAAVDKTQVLTLRRQRIAHILGITIDDQEVCDIFESLGMSIEENEKGWRVRVPSYRFDLSQEIDLIEELARLHGYDKIPQTTLQCKLTMPVFSETELRISKVRQLMLDRGYHEVVTYSFINKAFQHMINPNHPEIKLSNPITQDMAVMRNSLWPGLIDTLRYNLSRQMRRVRLFEIGRCFVLGEKEEQQVMKLAGLIAGDVHSIQWGADNRPVDFFDIKGDMDALLSTIGNGFDFIQGQHSSLHPGQSATICREGRCIGQIGALHPTLIRQLDLSVTPYLFEIEWEAIKSMDLPHFQGLSKFPSISRDIALLVGREVEAAQIKKKITETAGQLLIMAEIFDIYDEVKHVALGKKSVALTLTFQDPSRTLLDNEVNQIIERVITDLEHTFDAKLRA